MRTERVGFIIGRNVPGQAQAIGKHNRAGAHAGQATDVSENGFASSGSSVSRTILECGSGGPGPVGAAAGASPAVVAGDGQLLCAWCDRRFGVGSMTVFAGRSFAVRSALGGRSASVAACSLKVASGWITAQVLGTARPQGPPAAVRCGAGMVLPEVSYGLRRVDWNSVRTTLSSGRHPHSPSGLKGVSKAEVTTASSWSPRSCRASLGKFCNTSWSNTAPACPTRRL